VMDSLLPPSDKLFCFKIEFILEQRAYKCRTCLKVKSPNTFVQECSFPTASEKLNRFFSLVIVNNLSVEKEQKIRIEFYPTNDNLVVGIPYSI
jgi:hypothetical protein